MACKRSGVQIPLAPPPSPWQPDIRAGRRKPARKSLDSAFRRPVSETRHLSRPLACASTALARASMGPSIIRPSRLATARPVPASVLCRFDNASGGFKFRRRWDKGSVQDGDLVRVNREAAGGTQRAGLPRSGFKALQVAKDCKRVRQDKRCSSRGTCRLYHQEGRRKQQFGCGRGAHAGGVVLGPEPQPGDGGCRLGNCQRLDHATRIFNQRDKRHGMSGQGRCPGCRCRSCLWQNDDAGASANRRRNVRFSPVVGEVDAYGYRSAISPET